jgi:hypothetical protein
MLVRVLLCTLYITCFGPDQLPSSGDLYYKNIKKIVLYTDRKYGRRVDELENSWNRHFVEGRADKRASFIRKPTSLVLDKNNMEATIN